MAQAGTSSWSHGSEPDAEGDQEPEGDDDMDGWLRERAVIYQLHPPRAQSTFFWVDVNREVRVYFLSLSQALLLSLAAHRTGADPPTHLLFLAPSHGIVPTWAHWCQPCWCHTSHKAHVSQAEQYGHLLALGIHTKPFFFLGPS